MPQCVVAAYSASYVWYYQWCQVNTVGLVVYYSWIVNTGVQLHKIQSDKHQNHPKDNQFKCNPAVSQCPPLLLNGSSDSYKWLNRTIFNSNIAQTSKFPASFPVSLLGLEGCRVPGGADSGRIRPMALQLPQDTCGNVSSIDGHGKHLTQHQFHWPWTNTLRLLGCKHQVFQLRMLFYTDK